MKNSGPDPGGVDRGRDVLWRVTVGLVLNAHAGPLFPAAATKSCASMRAFDDPPGIAYL